MCKILWPGGGRNCAGEKNEAVRNKMKKKKKGERKKGKGKRRKGKGADCRVIFLLIYGTLLLINVY